MIINARAALLHCAVLTLLVASGAALGQAAPAAAAPAQDGEPMRLELVWSIGHKGYGVFQGVDVDRATGEVYAACNWRGRPDGWQISVARFDRHGNELARIGAGPFKEGSYGDFRLANLDGKGGPEMLVAGVWSPAVHAFDAEGKTCWSYLQPHGVDAVCAQDLDEDGRDEVFIGYNGDGGVHALNPEGTLRWKSTIIGNVWSVAAGPTGPDGAMRVLAPGRGDQVQVFDPSGKALDPLSLRPGGAAANNERARRGGGLHPHTIRISQACPEPVVLVSDHRAKMIAGLDGLGAVLWRRSFVGGTSLSDAMASPDRPWFALALDRGRIVVHDVQSGERMVATDVPGAGKLAWVPASGEEPPLLIVDAYNSLKAYAVRGSAPAPRPAPPDLAALGLPEPDPARGQPVAWFRESYIYPADLEGTDLQTLIIDPLLQEFTQEQKLEATDEQIASFNRWFARQSGQISPEDPQLVTMQDQVARAFVEQWLLGKALYERYGGVVIFQQANPMEPVGAMRRFLEDHQTRGSFKILDPEHRELFWSYYTREHPMQVSEEDIDFSRPWWEQTP